MYKLRRNTLQPLILALSLSSSVAFSADYFQEAKTYYESGDKKAAVIQLKNLLQDSPEHQAGRALLGNIMLEQRQFGAAEKELRQAISLGADKADLVPKLIRSQLMQGKVALAEETLENRWDKSINPSERWQMLGRIYVGQKRLTEAESAFYQSLQIKSNPQSTYGLALIARFRGSWDEALGILEPIIENTDVRFEALTLKADILLETRKAKEAVSILSQLISEDHPNLRLKLSRSRGYLLLGDFEKAKADIQSLPKNAKETPPALLIQSMVAMGEKKYDEAYNFASAILQQIPNSPRAMLIAGSSRYITQDYQTALTHLKEYVALVPRDPNGLRILAATQQSLKQSSAALETLAPLLQQAEVDPRAAAIAGYAHISLGDWEEGQKLLAAALKKQPGLSKLQNQLVLSQIMSGRGDSALESIQSNQTQTFQNDALKVIAYVQQNQVDQARAFVNQRIEEQPNEPSYFLLDAMLNIRKGDLKAAENSYNQALKINPSFMPALLAMARLELEQKDYEGAKKHYKQALAAGDKNLTALLGLATVAERQNDQKTMIHWLSQARERNPNSLHPVASFVRYYIAKKEMKKARKEAYSFQLDHPDMPEAKMLYISTLKASRKFSEAEKLVDQLLETYPGRDLYQRTKAELLRDTNKRKEALKYSKRALNINPNDPKNQLLHIDLLLLTGNAKKAAPLAEALWKKYQNPTSARMLGLVRLAESRAAEAVELLEDASKAGVDALLANALSSAYQQTGQSDKAISLLDELVKKQPKDFNSRFRLATAYQLNGHYPEAIEQYERLRDQQPKNPVIWNNLAWLYQQTKDNRSVDHAREALRLAPNRPDIKDTLGWILLEQGEVDEALPLLQDAAKQLPQLDEVQYHLAVALVKKDLSADARNILDPLIKGQGPFKQKAQKLLKQIEAN